MKCPKCETSITAHPDEKGFFQCPSCGARLRARSQPARKRQPPAPPEAAAPVAPGEAPSLDPGATLRPEAPSAPAEGSGGPGLDTLLAEIKEVRRVQDEILSLLRARPLPPPPARAAKEHDEIPFAGAGATISPQPPRPAAGRRNVLLVDDDAAVLEAAAIALQEAGVPVRTAGDGNTALREIGEKKPDVIVLEIALEGPMPGRDLINLIKATMDWVDIPILLYTRIPVTSDEEARTVHGGDGFVLKGPNATAALVSRVSELLARR